MLKNQDAPIDSATLAFVELNFGIGGKAYKVHCCPVRLMMVTVCYSSSMCILHVCLRHGQQRPWSSLVISVDSFLYDRIWTIQAGQAFLLQLCHPHMAWSIGVVCLAATLECGCSTPNCKESSSKVIHFPALSEDYFEHFGVNGKHAPCTQPKLEVTGMLLARVHRACHVCPSSLGSER